ncbi:polyphosphate polymerase domain-containing protein [Corynebacterium sp. CCUG 18816]|uniref:polyphosphate polymerase domain-containing protein n=1 Tax=Corynebacterium pseudogenitalium TaxID=38303 RepID=UPI00210DD995|nr:polyphosphate polymerase domain-containing protein [Corynebacterium pseudogenitalium]MCQ4617317.1 polyphosphate polymerase domain-containing protein [Corynebacterium pseudogenitalium]
MRTLTLDELNSQDAMMTRVDRKYLLHHHELDAVLADFPPETKALEVAGTTQQTYTTTYFDTRGLRCYHDAAYGRRGRFKVRSRTYTDTGVSFLEFKAKGPRGVTSKQRIPLDDPEALEWLASHLPMDVTWNDFAPTLTNTYRRMTLSPPDVGRVTVDTQLQWHSLITGQWLEGLDLVFIETKSTATPSSIDRVLWAHNHRPTRVSKFGCGMATLHPALPANKWHRNLTTYFERSSHHAHSH